ncbi:D-arabinose 1-dehydrogenase-like Zn-dependent alcohol dehydrogenase [Bradyrhizobium sp. ERR14]|nr:D-arabinose 1-dehydrogenase-like Zn-dependent alcohol dehydrogenase [Bradyrhizobium sp. ERR14]
MPTMKAAIVKQFGKPLVIEDVPVPQPGPGEILVKVKACGVCHTDLHAASGDWPVKPVPPFIPGHEAAGTVAALGPGVKNLKVGDAVGVAWLHDACSPANIARPAGKPCASTSTIPATASTAALPNMSSPRLPLQQSCRRRSILPPSRRSCARASPPTRD